MKQVFRSPGMGILQDNEANSGSGKQIQERLLDAAEELFSEKGFDGTSIRDITAAAECNIASVNYHFGGKDKLYIELWRRQLGRILDARIAAIRAVMSRSGGSPSLEELLRSFANAFIEPLADQNKSRRFIKLMAREMLDQHLPVDTFIEEMVIPTMTTMREALGKACPGLEESKVPLVVFSIAGQLAHTAHMKAMFEQADNPEMPTLDLAEAVDHIVKFSAAGIRAYAEGKTE